MLAPRDQLSLEVLGRMLEIDDFPSVPDGVLGDITVYSRMLRGTLIVEQLHSRGHAIAPQTATRRTEDGLA